MQKIQHKKAKNQITSKMRTNTKNACKKSKNRNIYRIQKDPKAIKITKNKKHSAKINL